MISITVISISLILLLWKNVYKYMNDWEKYSEKPLPDKKIFSGNLNMKIITDAQFCKNFEIKIYINTMNYMFKVIHY